MILIPHRVAGGSISARNPIILTCGSLFVHEGCTFYGFGSADFQGFVDCHKKWLRVTRIVVRASGTGWSFNSPGQSLGRMRWQEKVGHACYKTTFSRLTSGVSGLTLWTVWCTCLTATLKMSKALILWGSCWVFCRHAIEDWRLFIPLNPIFSCFLPRWVAVASYDNSQSDIDVMFEYKYPHFFIVIAVDFHIPSFITHHSW